MIRSLSKTPDGLRGRDKDRGDWKAESINRETKRGGGAREQERRTTEVSHPTTQPAIVRVKVGYTEEKEKVQRQEVIGMI